MLQSFSPAAVAHLIMEVSELSEDMSDLTVLKQRRQTLVDRWLEAAQTVVDQTNNEDAMSVLKFVRRNGVLAEPLRSEGGIERVKDFHHSTEAEAFHLVALFNEDRQLGKPWSFFLGAESCQAFFGPKQRRMALIDRPSANPIISGCTLLHEGRHAREYLTHPGMNVGDERTYCYDELDAYQMEAQLFAKLGGELYDDLLAQRLKALAGSSAEEEFDRFVRLGPDRRWDAMLMALFPGSSSDDADVVSSYFWYDTMFRKIAKERGSKDAVRDFQAKFMRSLFKLRDSGR